MSDIQRIGYHLLYNVGVKIERDKSKPLNQNNKNKGTARTTKGKNYYEKDCYLHHQRQHHHPDEGLRKDGLHPRHQGVP